MKELKEIRFNETDVILNDNLVRGSILPQRFSELTRNIIFTGDTVVEGPIFANRMEIRNGIIDLQGAVFIHQELYISSEMSGSVDFHKAVGSAGSIVSRAPHAHPTFYSDINARQVKLDNAFVAGSIYADEISLENCVVIGGVFATQSASLSNTIVGTFNAPEVSISGKVELLLPSAFSNQPLRVAPGAQLSNLALADLGDLYVGKPQSSDSGRIIMSPEADEVRSTLADDERSHRVLCYTVVGKVLAADLVNLDKFRNHFLLSAAALGTQLLRTYDLGLDANGKPAMLTMDNLRNFFFDILSGRIEVKPMDGHFSLSQIAGRHNAERY